MAIAIPTGVKIVNWTLTMWGGKLTFTTAMLFAIGLVVEFTIGGLSGVTHSVAPSDTQQTDTYYIVAHFHYVLFGGAVLGFFAGFYYWWPKVFGKCLSEKLGKWNFWTMIVGLNMTFGPMHIIGLQGQPRRMYIWTEARAGEGFFNLAFWNLRRLDRCVHPRHRHVPVPGQRLRTTRKGAKAPLDPWDARTLEWMTTSPPKEHNFDSLPTVHALDEFFHRKYEDVGEGDAHDLRQVATAEDILAEMEANADHHIHMPSPSYWPIVLAFSLPFIAYGVIFSRFISIVGVVILLLAMFGWAMEPSVAPDSDFDPVPHPRTRALAPPWRPSGVKHERAERRGWARARGQDLRARRPRPGRRRAGQPQLDHRDDRRGHPDGRHPGSRSDRRCRHPPGAHPPDGHARGGRPTAMITVATPRRPASPTTSWRCGSSSAPSACCSAA